MKKILLVLGVALLACVYVQAQDTLKIEKPKKSKDKITRVYSDPNVEKPEIIRDRLVFDVFHSFWMGMPKEVAHKKFDPGFAVSALWDFKLPNKSPLSFGLGLCFTYYSQFTDAMLKVDDGWVMKYNYFDSGIKYKLNRINYMNCSIPIEFRYRHKCGFKFAVGGRIGLIAEVSQNYKGTDPYDGVSGRHFKNREIYNTQNYSVEVYTRIGWKAIAVFYSFHVTKLFDDGEGPAIFPMSLGISISAF